MSEFNFPYQQKMVQIILKPITVSHISNPKSLERKKIISIMGKVAFLSVFLAITHFINLDTIKLTNEIPNPELQVRINSTNGRFFLKY